MTGVTAEISRERDRSREQRDIGLGLAIVSTSDMKARWYDLQGLLNRTATMNGFNEDAVNQNKAEKICLMHSELSEALEAVRHGCPPDDKIPEFGNEVVELADCFIRMLDYAHTHKLPLFEAVIAKAKYNLNRPFKHGKAF